KAGETKQAEITLQPDPQAQTPPTSGEPGTLTELEPTDSSTTYPVARKKPSWIPVIIGGAVTAVAAGVYVGFRLRAEDARDDAERLTADATEQFGQHPCSLAGLPELTRPNVPTSKRLVTASTPPLVSATSPSSPAASLSPQPPPLPSSISGPDRKST